MCLVDEHWQLHARLHGKRRIDHPICAKVSISMEMPYNEEGLLHWSSTHLISKYLALLAMPPPLRKLSASMSDRSTCGGYRMRYPHDCQYENF